MKIYLHIGSHKTATTSIQDFSSRNASWLRNNGILYPSFDIIGGQKQRSHLNLMKGLVGGTALPEFDSCIRLLREAHSIAKAEKLDVFFSAESLFRFNERQTDIIVRIFLETFGSNNIVIVCSLRSRSEFAESLYRNSYRAFLKVPQNFVDWFNASNGNFQYERIIKNYSDKLGGCLLLLPYSKSTRGNFLDFFFKNIGLNVSDQEENFSSKNPSLDLVDCLAKLEVMSGRNDESLSKRFNNFAFSCRIATDYAFLHRDLESVFESKFLSENRRLIDLEPRLESVLGADVPLLRRSVIDANCNSMVEERVRQFYNHQKD